MLFCRASQLSLCTPATMTRTSTPRLFASTSASIAAASGRKYGLAM
jgi:hypothetical protein